MVFQSIRSLVSRVASLSPTAEKVIETDGGIVWRVHSVRRGGMGIVRLCSLYSENKTAPSVALKTFDDKYFFNLEMQSAVETEMVTWLRVSDAPYVLPLLGIVTAKGKPQLMMPAIVDPAGESMTLGAMIRKSKTGLPSSVCAQMAFRLTIGMSECTRLVPDLVHGDIKPENILIGAEPFLADFGAASLAQRAGIGPTAKGTALYLAPECWKDGSPPTPASDVYAFGATLFEMLSGHSPFAKGGGDIEGLKGMHASLVPTFQRAPQDTLETELRQVAVDCLMKDPAGRPADFRSLLGRFLKIMNEHDPVDALVAMAGTLQKRSQRKDDPALPLRITALLQQGDGANALQILSGIPEEQLDGQLLKLAGTAHSLAGNDEKAIELFKRYLSTEPEAKEHFSCLNEIGLSLKRLGRLKEAKELYEKALEDVPRQFDPMLRGNYAGTLLELDETDHAINILERLTRTDVKSPETWALLSMAHWKQKNGKKAAHSMRQAIALRPRNGNYRVMLAEYLLSERDVGAALESLEYAFQLGFHSRQWALLSLACYALADRRDEAASLLQALKREVGEEEATRVLDDAMELSRRVAEPSDPASQELEPTAEPAPPSHEEPAEQTSEPASSDAVDDATRRQWIREGRRPHMQMRWSTVDGSFALDFYYGIDQADYAEQFGEAIKSLSLRLDSLSSDMQLRAKAFEFFHCQHCETIILSNRDVAESFSCQACERRGETKPVRRTKKLSTLLDRALAAARIEATEVPDGVLFVGIWPKDAAQSDAIKRLFTAANYRLITGVRGIHTYMLMQMVGRDREQEGSPEVWARDMQDSKATYSADGTPADLDKLIRDLRREAGSVASMSMLLPKGEQLDMMLATAAEQLEQLRALAQRTPDNLELQRTLIETEVRENHVDAAAQHLKRLMVQSPDDVDVIAAAGAVYLAQERFSDAVTQLERVLALRPLDQTARIKLIHAYRGMGDDRRAGMMLQQLRSHGISFLN